MSQAPSRSPRRASDGWAPTVLLVLAAVLVGALVLPRFGRGLEGKAAPDFSLPVIFGGEPDARLRLSEQRGKLVLLDFWASWCAPCREQAKVLAKLQARADARDVVVLGINTSDQPDAARRYLEQSRPSWPVLEDTQNDAADDYQVTGLPTLVAIARDGRIFAVRRRFVPESELMALLEAMRHSS